MSYIVHQKIKGRIYVYEATKFWDRESKKSKQSRKYLGVLGKDGKITNPHKTIKIKGIRDYGAIYALDFLAKECKLHEVVKQVFPDDYQTIMNLVYFKVIDHQPYYLFQSWAEGSYLFEGNPLISQDLSDFCDKLGEDEDSHKEFFIEWIKRNKNHGTLIFDITSISSYSVYNEWLEWGYNRDGEKLRQLNLGAIVSQDLGLPLAYRFCQGSISDVVTLKNTTLFAQDVGIDSIKFVLDKGFYSLKNVSDMIDKKLDFIVPLPFSTKEAKRIINKTKEELASPSNAFHYDQGLMYHTAATASIGKNNLNAHVFLNTRRQTEQLSDFFRKLNLIEERVLEKVFKTDEDILRFLDENFASFKEYFFIKNLTLKRNDKSISENSAHMGKIIILTNCAVSKLETLDIYLKKDIVEKCFDQMKNELEDKRLRVASKKAFSARLFITYLALILRTYLTSKSFKAKLNKNLKVPEIIAQLNLIRRVATNDSYFLSEISKTHRVIFDKLNIPIPV